MVSGRICPISSGEFVQMFQRCSPPTGWQSKLAVANSGGPDSTCLLFLINRLLSEERSKAEDLPSSVVSLTVDHGLQVSSPFMAKRCSSIASSMGVEHHTSAIPWSQAPFPENPSALGSLEETARLARYHVLFHAMTHVGAKALAVGHHADDQVETSLMRIARGTTELGAGGMRQVRRWGMGAGYDSSSLGWAGHEGMSRWILRPLLEVSKDRILATCHENKLQYVTDTTNFQPDTTLRNALRQMLKRMDHNTAVPQESGHDPNLPIHFKESLEKIHEAGKSFSMDISAGREQLRASVKRLSSRVEEIDLEVSAHLKKHRLSSPVGTFLLSTQGLSEIQDEAVRKAMILRILRFISFHPWGSIRADGNRRSKSLRRIIDNVWCPNPWGFRIGSFTAGGGVQWQPVSVQYPGGKMLLSEQLGLRGGLKHLDVFGWLATRTRPPRTMEASQLTLDVTERLSDGLTKRARMVEVLYDCRFLIRFNIAKIQGAVAESLLGSGRHDTKILILPETMWHWPKILWLRDGNLVSLATIGTQPVGEMWIHMNFIRTLDGP